MGIKHKFTSPKSDGADTTFVRPSDWNAEHDIVFVKETPGGLVNGANKLFTLSATPETGSLELKLNGLPQWEGDDYALAGNQITMTNAPISGDQLRAKFL